MERIVSKPSNNKYREEYDRIFGSDKFTEEMGNVFDKIRGTDIVINKKDINEG